MRIAGLGINENTLNNLLEILKTPQKSGDFLKSIKRETAALNKVRKDIGGMTSAKTYTEDLKAEAEHALEISRKAVAEIKIEEKKAKAVAKKLVDRQIKLTEDATKANTEMSHKIRQYDNRALEIAVMEETLDKQEKKIAIDQARAESLKEEYTIKLKDLKDRMRGL